MKHRLFVIGIAVAAMASLGTASAQEQCKQAPSLEAASAQELTPEQSKKLASIGLDFSEKITHIENLIQDKTTQLAFELKRGESISDPKEAKKTTKEVNATLEDLSDLYGQLIKTKVEFVVAAKNVLTREQKLLLLSQLKPSENMPYATIEYMQPTIFDLPLNLSIDQKKELISIKANFRIDEVKLDRDVAMTLLDLEDVLLSDKCEPSKVDPLVMKLATLAGKEIDNYVDHFLKAKDVLTLDQKRLLVHMLGID